MPFHTDPRRGFGRFPQAAGDFFVGSPRTACDWPDLNDT